MSYNQFTLSIDDRFWNNIKVDENGCRLWQGKLREDGYARFSVSGKKIYVHVFSYKKYKSSYQEGLELDHLCRVRHCSNPDHLEPVTKLENYRRGNGGKNLGKLQSSKTHCPQGHEYTKENTLLRKQYKRNGIQRNCKICTYAQNSKSKNRKEKLDGGCIRTSK